MSGLFTANANIPNPTLINELYQKYFLRDEVAQLPFVSSYWSMNSKKFKVDMDGENNLQALSGFAMGTLMADGVKKILKGALDTACHISYLPGLPHRSTILRLIPAAYQICRAMNAYFSFVVIESLRRCPEGRS